MFLRKAFHNILGQSLIMTGGLSVRIVGQALLFLIGAKVLGSDQFGLFVGVQSLYLFIAPFANWGSGYILIKHVTRKSRPLTVQWGSSLVVTLIAGTSFSILGWLLLWQMYSLKVAVTLGIPLAFGEIFGQSLVAIASQAFQSLGRLESTSFSWSGLSLSRLGFIILLLLWVDKPSVEQWALFYGMGGFASGLLSNLWLMKSQGKPHITLQGMKGEWGQGFSFAINNAAQTANNHIDKTLLSEMLSNAIAGVYAVSYRILDAIFLPVQGLIFVLTPRLFAAGGEGLNEAGKRGKRFLPIAVGWSAVAWGGAWLISPVVARFLGEGYEMIPQITKVLGFILAFRALHALASVILAGADYQPVRSGAQIFVALTNVGLNVWWIPRMGWRAAAYSSIISDALLAFILWAFITALARKRQNDSQSA